MALKWRGDKAFKKISLGLSERLDAASMKWVKYTGEKLNEKVNRPIKTRNGTLRSGNTPSKPGDKYPAQAHGHLKKSIDWDKDGPMVRRVGTNVEYGKFLELKEPSNGGRPWMSSANRETKTMIRDILNRPFRFSKGWA